MKKNKILFILASAALLASCGGGAQNSASTPASQGGASEPASVSAELKIELSIDKATIKVGETAQLTSSVEGVSFEARDASIVSIDASGVVTGLKAGSTRITARKTGYKVGSVDITVEKATAKAADFYLEFEDAEHYDPDGFWGMEFWGQVYGPGDSPIEETEAAHGGKSVGWFTQGCKETIYFTSDKAGKVDLDFMMAYNAEMALQGVVEIKVNGTALDLTGKVVAGPEEEGDYYDFNPIGFTGIDVVAGENKIEVTALAQGPNMDCVQVYTKELQIAQVIKQAAKPVSLGTVDYYVEGFEFGPAITGVLAHFKGAVAKGDLSHLTVKTNGRDRIIENVYLADESGNPSDANQGNIVRFDLTVQYTSTMMTWGDYSFPSSNDFGCSPFVYANNVNNWNPNLSIAVEIASGSTIEVGGETYGDEVRGRIDEIGERIILSTKDWTEARTHTANGKTLSYKAYETDALKNDGVKDPLIIWLHGAGEGGTDPDIALLGNDVTNLGEEKIQSHFEIGQQKGAYVLAVQTPTMWMDTGNGQNHSGNAHSVYTETLKSTIDKYLEENPDADESRIFLGGCSNGGYMTMEMAINYPSFFKAYYPTCEAYQNAFLTDQDVAKLKDLSMWFTHAANDTTVDPNNFTVPTYKRLIDAGASDVHFSYFVDVKGNECNPDGEMNDHMGHYSWIYVLKDECAKDQADPNNIAAPSTKDVMVNGQAVTMWGWMASK